MAEFAFPGELTGGSPLARWSDVIRKISKCRPRITRSVWWQGLAGPGGSVLLGTACHVNEGLVPAVVSREGPPGMRGLPPSLPPGRYPPGRAR